MNQPVQRRVARALRAGGPEVIEVAVEELRLWNRRGAGESRSCRPQPCRDVDSFRQLRRSPAFSVPAWWRGIGSRSRGRAGDADIGGDSGVLGSGLGSCATFMAEPACMLAPIPDGLSFEDAACLAVAGLTAGGLARVWPLKERKPWCGEPRAPSVECSWPFLRAGKSKSSVSPAANGWTPFAPQGPCTLSIEPLRTCVKRFATYTGGRGVAAVFDPIGAPPYETSLQLLAPRGCLISYGELSGPAPAINLHQLFPGPFSSPSTTGCIGSKVSP